MKNLLSFEVVDLSEINLTGKTSAIGGGTSGGCGCNTGYEGNCGCPPPAKKELEKDPCGC